MTAVITAQGTAHLVELAAGGSLTNSFDGLVLGAGNDDPAASNTLDNVTQRLPFVMRLADGFPKLNDTDARNTGRGQNVYTWRFERPAGEPFVASNVAVTNYSGGALMAGAALLVHAKETIAQRYDERLVVWVNAAQGQDPTVVFAGEQALEGRVQRVVGFVARNRAMAASPDGSVVDSDEVKVRAALGQHVWTAADVVGLQGQQLTAEDVESFTITTERLKASTGGWERIGVASALDCYRHVQAAYTYSDNRWNASGGFNVAHSWSQPRGTQEGTYRLRYKMKLCDGDVRKWTTIVEVT